MDADLEWMHWTPGVLGNVWACEDRHNSHFHIEWHVVLCGFNVLELLNSKIRTRCRWSI